jgi:hypothetical protein
VSIADKLVTVAENQQKVYKAGVLSQCPKTTVFGESLNIDDVAPVEHNMTVKLSSKNIYNPKGRITPKTVRGLTIQYLEDEDCYLLNGTTEITNNYYQINENILVDDYISIAVSVVGGSVNNPNNKYVRFYVGSKDTENGTTSNWKDINLVDGVGKSTTSKKYIGASWFYIGDGVAFDNFKVRISIEKGTVATSYTPHIADISTVKLDALGKNLIPYPYQLGTRTLNGITFTDNGDGTITANGTATAATYYSIWEHTKAKVSITKGEFYTLSGCPDGGGSSTYQIACQCVENNSWLNLWDKGTGATTTAKGDAFVKVIIYIANGATVDNVVFKPMLEKGASTTPYEPYKVTTYTPNADGIVEGVKSIYPVTNLFLDTEGVLIEAKYHQIGVEAGRQSEYGLFWDNFQQNGNRTHYAEGFAGAGWTEQNFKPKYDLKPQYTNSMFSGTTMKIDLPSHLESIGIALDTSKAEQLGSMFYSTQFTRVGVIDFSSNKAANGILATVFAYSRQLHTIDGIIILESQTLQNCFTNCVALRNVTIDGVIGKSVSWQYSTLLSRASIENIVGCLSPNVTGQTITLSTTAVNNAFTTDEWNALIADKTNWTFSLV